MRISDWSSDVCSSDLSRHGLGKDSAGTSGRSAREATGKFKEASKFGLMNGTRGGAGAAAAFALVASFGAQAADPASCKEVSLADVGWTDITATTAATSVVLEGLGYQPEAEVLSVPVTYASPKNGDIDIFLGNWMPTMEGDIDRKSTRLNSSH